MANETYNGWTNRATWVATLWISESYLVDVFNEQASTLAQEAADDPAGLTVAELRDIATEQLAEVMQVWFDEQWDSIQDAAQTKSFWPMFSDIIGNPCKAVNWLEIAQHHVEDAFAEVC